MKEVIGKHGLSPRGRKESRQNIEAIIRIPNTDLGLEV